MLPGVTLSAFSDSGVLGDNKTTFSTVSLVGQTSANAIVRLKGTGRSTVADDKGRFLFSNVALAAGGNEFKVVAIDAEKQRSVSTTSIRRVAADRVSAIVEWNANALRAIVTGATPPPAAARSLAIVHTAMFDAVNSIVDRYKAYRVNLDAPAGASAEAAAVTAAYETLIKLFPTQKATFDAAYQNSLAKIPDGQSETDGIAIGRSVAATILESRKMDGATTAVSYTPSTTPGLWRPSAPEFKPAALPQWKNVTPFTMTSGSQFRPAAPPPLTSKICAEELEQVRILGRLNSRRRTAEQTEIALYWADGGGTYTPPGHWNQIVEQIAAEGNGALIKDARTFALLNLGLADAGIAAWDAKYTYNSWRPIDALRLADTDGNPRTQAAPGWNPLISTPNHPDYISGHSTFSGAASQILTSLFGDRYTFTSGSIGLPGVTRTFNSFRQAANEAGISRIYGGIHTESANRAGKATGRALADYIVANFLTPL
ncbi:vanadium-dependent haloperoxidase [Microcoleus sp. FACHB-1515]|nr:vanadium-dependent haloperoxidase [Microcoleus sp. FACHB-1515]